MAYREDRSVPEAQQAEAEQVMSPEAPAPRARRAPQPPSPAERSDVREEAKAPPTVEPASPKGEDADRKPKSGRKRLVLLAVLLVVLMGGGYYGWRYWVDGRFLVTTDDAYVAGDITILAAKIPGYIKTIEVQNDQPVKEGEVVARIDDVDYKLAVQAARDKLATLEATTARIERQVAAAKAQVAQAAPQIDAARADQIRAASEYDRQAKLAQSDFASRAKFEQARADRDRSIAAVKSAEAALAVARANVDVLEAQRIESARTADEARTQLARAERDLAFTEIRAPVSGVIGNRAIQVGSYVMPGSRLAALVPLATVHIDANFKETQLASIKPGQTVRLEVDAYPGLEVPATVESIAPASGSQYSLLPPENATGNFTKIVQRVPVRVKVDPEIAAEGKLRPGMSVVARVDIRPPKTVHTAQDATAQGAASGERPGGAR